MLKVKWVRAVIHARSKKQKAPTKKCLPLTHRHNALACIAASVMSPRVCAGGIAIAAGWVIREKQRGGDRT
jgi:hypothetical protein